MGAGLETMRPISREFAAYRNGRVFRLCAYVCSQTCVKRAASDPPPTASFAQIYQSRPRDCRYAVVAMWDVARYADRFYVFDLFNVKKTPKNELVVPRPRLVHDHLDAAIMATVLLYNKEPKNL